jgi:hypothetical protein
MRSIAAFALALLVGAGGVMAQPHVAALAAEGQRVLTDDTVSFTERAAWTDRVERALGAEHRDEAAGRLALLWMQGMRRTLSAIPHEVTYETRAQPYAAWLEARAREVVYNEPGGQWQVAPEPAWTLHDRHRRTSSAEALAWEIVENGLPGECEGYPPCYLAGFEQLHGRYLREHPAGSHAAQAVTEIHESLEQIERLLSGPDARDFFDPATDCADLIKGAEPLGMVLAAAKVETTATRRALAKIRDRCK